MKKITLILLIIVLLSFPAFIPVSAEITNLFDRSAISETGYVKLGREVKSDKMRSSDYIPVSAGETLYISPIDTKLYKAAFPVAEFYRFDRSYLSDKYIASLEYDGFCSEVNIVRLDIPDDVSFVKINTEYADVGYYIVSKEEFTMDEFLDRTKMPKPDLRYDSPLFGKKALFCGDSICEATVEAWNTEHPEWNRIAGWAGRIGTYNDMDFLNKGLGGAAFSYFNPEKNPTYLILTQLQSEEKNAESYDLVLLHGGVNDGWDKVPIGDVTDDFDETKFDMKTLCGAMEYTFWYAKKTYTNAAIGYLVNFPTHSSWGYLSNMTKYWEMAKKVCKKWDIPYLDMFTIFRTTKIPTDHGGDGIHPNHEGYEIITPKIQEFCELLVTEYMPKSEPTVIQTPDAVETISPTVSPETASAYSDTAVPGSTVSDIAAPEQTRSPGGRSGMAATTLIAIIGAIAAVIAAGAFIFLKFIKK